LIFDFKQKKILKIFEKREKKQKKNMALKQVSFLFPLARASALRQVSLRTATPCSRLYSDSSKSTWSKSQVISI